MNRRERDLRKLVNSECHAHGLPQPQLEITGSGHFRVRIALGPGITRTVVFPYSPGDRRSVDNAKAQLRRLLNDHQ